MPEGVLCCYSTSAAGIVISLDGSVVAIGFAEARDKNAVRVYRYDSSESSSYIPRGGQALQSPLFGDNDDFGEVVALDENGRVLAVSGLQFSGLTVKTLAE